MSKMNAARGVAKDPFLYKNANLRIPGRPLLNPTDQQRKAVVAMAMAHYPERLIAHRLGISRGTLRRHFKDDLQRVRSHKRAEVIMALWNAARSGKVSAMIYLDKLMVRAAEAEARKQRSQGL